MRATGDRAVRGGDRRLSDRGYGAYRGGDQGGSLAPGTITYSDNFNRADGGLGSNWTTITPATSSGGNMEIATNRVKCHYDDDHEYAAYTGATFTDNQWSQVTCVNIGAWNGPIVRAKLGVDRFYIGMVFAANDYRIYLRWDGGYPGNNPLAQGSSVTWSAGDVAKITATGTHPVVLKLYRNGVQVLSFTSTGVNDETAGGSPGMGMYSPAGQNLRLDDWSGGNL